MQNLDGVADDARSDSGCSGKTESSSVFSEPSHSEEDAAVGDEFLENTNAVDVSQQAAPTEAPPVEDGDGLASRDEIQQVLEDAAQLSVLEEEDIRSLKRLQLCKRAEELGARVDEIERALEKNDCKAALVKLVLAKKRQSIELGEARRRNMEKDVSEATVNAVELEKAPTEEDQSSQSSSGSNSSDAKESSDSDSSDSESDKKDSDDSGSDKKDSDSESEDKKEPASEVTATGGQIENQIELASTAVDGENENTIEPASCGRTENGIETPSTIVFGQIESKIEPSSTVYDGAKKTMIETVFTSGSQVETSTRADSQKVISPLVASMTTEENKADNAGHVLQPPPPPRARKRIRIQTAGNAKEPDKAPEKNESPSEPSNNGGPPETSPILERPNPPNRPRLRIRSSLADPPEKKSEPREGKTKEVGESGTLQKHEHLPSGSRSRSRCRNRNRGSIQIGRRMESQEKPALEVASETHTKQRNRDHETAKHEERGSESHKRRRAHKNEGHAHPGVAKPEGVSGQEAHRPSHQVSNNNGTDGHDNELIISKLRTSRRKRAIMTDGVRQEEFQDTHQHLDRRARVGSRLKDSNESGSEAEVRYRSSVKAERRKQQPLVADASDNELMISKLRSSRRKQAVITDDTNLHGFQEPFPHFGHRARLDSRLKDSDETSSEPEERYHPTAKADRERQQNRQSRNARKLSLEDGEGEATEYTSGADTRAERNANLKLALELFQTWILSTRTNQHEEKLRRRGMLSTTLDIKLEGVAQYKFARDVARFEAKATHREQGTIVSITAAGRTKFKQKHHKLWEDAPLPAQAVVARVSTIAKVATVANATCRFRIVGAGSSEFNGEYLPDGTQNGAACYRKLGGKQTANRSDGKWYLCIHHLGSWYYAEGDESVPPEQGWKCRDGLQPAPRLERIMAAESDRSPATDNTKSRSEETGPPQSNKSQPASVPIATPSLEASSSSSFVRTRLRQAVGLLKQAVGISNALGVQNLPESEGNSNSDIPEQDATRQQPGSETKGNNVDLALDVRQPNLVSVDVGPESSDMREAAFDPGSPKGLPAAKETELETMQSLVAEPRNEPTSKRRLKRVAVSSDEEDLDASKALQEKHEDILASDTLHEDVSDTKKTPPEEEHDFKLEQNAPIDSREERIERSRQGMDANQTTDKLDQAMPSDERAEEEATSEASGKDETTDVADAEAAQPLPKQKVDASCWHEKIVSYSDRANNSLNTWMESLFTQLGAKSLEDFHRLFPGYAYEVQVFDARGHSVAQELQDDVDISEDRWPVTMKVKLPNPKANADPDADQFRSDIGALRAAANVADRERLAKTLADRARLAATPSSPTRQPPKQVVLAQVAKTKPPQLSQDAPARTISEAQVKLEQNLPAVEVAKLVRFLASQPMDRDTLIATKIPQTLNAIRKKFSGDLEIANTSAALLRDWRNLFRQAM